MIFWGCGNNTMAKLMKFDGEALSLLESGVKKLSGAVKVTLGPRGRNVALNRSYALPLITNDGVTIAKEVELENAFENMGASLVKEVSIKTNDIAGDGTTTAIVLAEAIFSEGIKKINEGANPIILKEGIKVATDFVVERIKAHSKPVSSIEEIKQIATISSQSQEIGTLLADATKTIGEDGIITTSDSSTDKTTLSIAMGLEIDRGLISPYLGEENKTTTTLKNAFLLLTDKKISNINEILPILELARNQTRPLLIICSDIENEALATIVLNKMRGIISCAIIKAPSFGQKRKDILEDIAILTGGRFISEEMGENLSSASLEDLGQAKTIKITSSATTIIEGAGNEIALAERKNLIKHQIKEATDDFEKTTLTERLAKLSSGVAIISVGAASEVEQKEKKLRIEDAISAIKSAKEQGVIVGGGLALYRISGELEHYISSIESSEEKQGAEIILKALSSPLIQICKNAGINPEGVIKELNKNNDFNFGFNAKTLKFENLIAGGVIDPAFVTISAICNASSVCATMLTTSALISEKDDKKI